MNETLKNRYMSSVIGLLNIHNINQDNESSKPNEANMSVENGDHCYMNSSTGSVINNHNSIDYTNKSMKFFTNRYLGSNNGLPDVVEIDYTLPASAIYQYVNIE